MSEPVHQTDDPLSGRSTSVHPGDNPDGREQTKAWALWLLAGLVYLGYLVLVTLEGLPLRVTLGLAALPALRLLPEEMLLGVGLGVGWFAGGVHLEPYTPAGLLLASQLLALAAGRYGGRGWLIGITLGYLLGLWWVSR